MNDADDVLNIERLKEAFGDDYAAIANLLGLARDTEQRYIAALRDAIARRDSVALARAAHSIKGSASNIGASRVSRVAAAIEDDARSEQWERIGSFADELDRDYKELCVRIARYVAAANG